MEICPECGNKLIVEEKTIAEYFSCDKCGFEHIEYPDTCCLYPEIIPVRFYSDSVEAMLDTNDYRVYNQCQNCGKKIGQAISKNKYKKQEILRFNSAIVDNVSLIKKELQDLSKLIQERKIQRERDTFWDDYDDYLKSEKWNQIRELVLKRDNYICQSCLNAKADLVHHIDGRFRKNEPLFTLISVCERCDHIITEIERGNHGAAEEIKYQFNK